MSTKVIEKPNVLYASDVNLFQVRRIIKPEGFQEITQYLWVTDLAFHKDLADERWSLFDENDPLTWASMYLTDTEANDTLLAHLGKVHKPMVVTNKFGKWYIRRRVQHVGSKKATVVQYLWKTDLEWHLTCFPIDTPATEILEASIADSPAALETWDHGTKILAAYTQKCKVGIQDNADDGD